MGLWNHASKQHQKAPVSWFYYLGHWFHLLGPTSDWKHFIFFLKTLSKVLSGWPLISHHLNLIIPLVCETFNLKCYRNYLLHKLQIWFIRRYSTWDLQLCHYWLLLHLLLSWGEIYWEQYKTIWQHCHLAEFTLKIPK